jgi:hypothetical protein
MELLMDILRGYHCVFLHRYLKILSIGGIYSRIAIGSIIWIACILIGTKYNLHFVPIT